MSFSAGLVNHWPWSYKVHTVWAAFLLIMWLGESPGLNKLVLVRLMDALSIPYAVPYVHSIIPHPRMGVVDGSTIASLIHPLPLLFKTPSNRSGNSIPLASLNNLISLSLSRLLFSGATPSPSSSSLLAPPPLLLFLTCSQGAKPMLRSPSSPPASATS